MAWADLLIGKPGGNTVCEAINAGLPLIVHDPLPGSQRRTCASIEQRVGYWIKRPEDVSVAIESLWCHPQELHKLRENALAMNRPGPPRMAARGILDLLGVSERRPKARRNLAKLCGAIHAKPEQDLDDKCSL
jgi:processive 1,2-diacylglycerol beta-glucosyltransferase